MIDWHDAVRVLTFFINAYAFVLLILRYRANKENYNTKTIDLWYGLLMWSLAGCVFSVQGIVLDRPFTAAFVFMTAATLTVGKGVHAKGPWGNATPA